MKTKIAEIRKTLKITQKDLGKELNQTQQTISNWESGTTEPDLNSLVRISKLFRVSLERLLGIEESNITITKEELENLKEVEKIARTINEILERNGK